MYKIISIVILLFFNSCTGKEKDERANPINQKSINNDYISVSYKTIVNQDESIVITNFDDTYLPF